MMNEVLNYRFTEGSLKGQSFGNLFLLALNRICGSFDRARSRYERDIGRYGKGASCDKYQHQSQGVVLRTEALSTARQL